MTVSPTPRRGRMARVALAAGGAAAVLLGLAWLVRPLPVPGYAEVRAAWTPSDAWLLDRHGAVLARRRMDFDVRRLEWVALHEVSPALVAAVVAGEDRRFWTHGGVDWRGVAGAARDTLLTQRRRGASTITMQLAQLIAADDGRRGVARKLAQLRRARALEARWSKTQILEAYLNLLGFRGELQGVAAAAELLAGKSPDGLDRHESAVLAALLPAPGAGLERVVARACARLEHPRRDADCAALRPIARAMLGRQRAPRAPPALASHAARALLARPGDRLRSTLDASAQRAAEQALARQIARVTDRNVRDGAVLVVDTETGDVLAYVGAAAATSRAGRVDGVRALRQAGSTLKPFLYALAIERGYLTAASLLDDAPVNLDTANGLYIPQNYDRDFKGLVSVRTALGNSLNVPAVRALRLTGVDDFRERLFDLGYAGISREGDYYGFSLALGSAEVSLWQQAQAYRTLALGGRAAPLRLRADAPPAEPGVPVMSAAASFVVADVLADRAARVLTFGTDGPLAPGYWSAVKTGTSKDMRDNWCIGFSRRTLVAVWVGNFEGDSMHDVTGVTGAAPVWREVMDALHRGHAAPPPPGPPPRVVARRITFTPAHEPARAEWFVAGTEHERVEATPRAHVPARIDSPANATVIALDPDIPGHVQRVPLRARGGVAGLHFELDGVRIGAASRPVLWPPEPGVHRVALVDDTGRTVDRVQFTVYASAARMLATSSPSRRRQ